MTQRLSRRDFAFASCRLPLLGGAGVDPLRAGRRAVAPALLARHRAVASAQRFDQGLSRQGRGRLQRQDQDRVVRERPALSRSRSRQGADPGPGRNGRARQLDHHRHRLGRGLLPASGALRPADRADPQGDRRQARAISQRPDPAEAALACDRALSRSRFPELVLFQQADREPCRSQGHEDPQFRRRRPGLARALPRRHPQHHRVAERAAGAVAGHLRRAGVVEREPGQRQAVGFRREIFAGRTASSSPNTFR